MGSLSCSSGSPWLRETVQALMGILTGHNRYMRDLADLDKCHPLSDVAPLWPRGPSPIWLPALLPFIQCHPDQDFAAYIFQGLSQGFRIGFNRTHPLRGSHRNHPSTGLCPLAVTSRITSEVQNGRLVGPLPTYLYPLIHSSPIGLVPKPHSDKFRMIVDQSAPRGHGVNDGIREELCSLRYASVDQAVPLIFRLGQGTQLAKLDLQDAYRIVPVHPHDHPLLGMCWEGATYIDHSLPFGLRSAPKIFTAVVDMLAWAVHCSGVRYVLHYLDDFLLLGAPGSSEAQLALATTTRTFETLGVPVATHKTEGPALELTFLGILIDTNKFQLRLPADKLSRLRLMVSAWRSKRVSTPHDLQSSSAYCPGTVGPGTRLLQDRHKQILPLLPPIFTSAPTPLSAQPVPLCRLPNLSPPTVRVYLSGVRYHQIQAGGPDPSRSDMPQLNYVLRATQRARPIRSRQLRLPITPPILRHLHFVWAVSPITYTSRMLWAACCLGFFAFLRSGEFTCPSIRAYTSSMLSPADVTVDSYEHPTSLTVLLRASKTDVF